LSTFFARVCKSAPTGVLRLTAHGLDARTSNAPRTGPGRPRRTCAGVSPSTVSNASTPERLSPALPSASCTRRPNSAYCGRTPADPSLRSGSRRSDAVVFPTSLAVALEIRGRPSRQGWPTRSALSAGLVPLPGPEQHPIERTGGPQRGRDALSVVLGPHPTIRSSRPRAAQAAHRDRRSPALAAVPRFPYATTSRRLGLRPASTTARPRIPPCATARPRPPQASPSSAFVPLGLRAAGQPTRASRREATH